MNEVVVYFGNQAEMARRLKVAPAAVSQWIVSGIPPRRAIQIEIFTNGKFKAVDLIKGYK
mgnify:CR=1 FL=1